MPALLAAADHRCGGGERLADRTFVEQRSRRLVRTPEEDVGSAAESLSPGLGEPHELRGLGPGDRERLLRVDVLPGLERRARHGHMRKRRREVEHDVDRGRGQQILDRKRFQRVLDGERLAARRLEVGAGNDLERVEGGGIRRVRAADHAGADDADARPHAALPTMPVTAANERRTASSPSSPTSSCSTRSHSTPSPSIAGSTSR